MSASPLAWEATLALILGLVAYDFFFHVRKAHVPSLKEAALWSAGYVGVALLFGVAVLLFGGEQMGIEYFAGYVTEKALSVDNVFVFLVIMASFKVPREDLTFYTEANYERTEVGSDQHQDLLVQGLRINPETSSGNEVRVYVGDDFDVKAKPELFKEMALAFHTIEVERAAP